jgi:hypothetical protein
VALDARPPFDDNGVAKGCSFTPSISPCQEIAFSKRRALDAPQSSHRCSREGREWCGASRGNRQVVRNSTVGDGERRHPIRFRLWKLIPQARQSNGDCIMDVPRFDLRQLQRATSIMSALTDFPVKKMRGPASASCPDLSEDCLIKINYNDRSFYHFSVASPGCAIALASNRSRVARNRKCYR